MQTIMIQWHGPYKYDEIEKMRNNNLLYQIYGNHPIYGNNVLKYVGITSQKVNRRLKERGVIFNDSDYKNVSIYLGEVFDDTKNLEDNQKEELIKIAEKLIIYHCAPAYNSSNINSIGSDIINSDTNYHLMNFGRYRDLLPEISTMRWTGDFCFEYIYDYIREFANKLSVNIYEDNTEFGFNYNGFWIGIDENLWEEHNKPICIYCDDEVLRDKFKPKQWLDYPFNKEKHCGKYIPININSNEQLNKQLEELKKTFINEL